MADSSLKCNSVITRVWLLHKDLVGHFEAEAFSGVVIESMHGEGNLTWGDGIEAQVPRKELSDYAVHVLVGATLARGIGVSEEEVGIEGTCDPLIAGNLSAIVGRQRMHTGRESRHQQALVTLNERKSRTRFCRPAHVEPTGAVGY